MFIFFNPKSTSHNPPIPNSILSVISMIDGIYDYYIVDGNREEDPESKIKEYIEQYQIKYFCVTVMPGPQLQQAIPITEIVKQKYIEITVIWGGYFPSNQTDAVLNSGFVDYIINGQGECAFRDLIQALEHKTNVGQINNLIFKQDGIIIKTPKTPIIHPDQLPVYNYAALDIFYSIEGYLGKTFLGTKTVAYHSSMGCPFTCAFCAVVPIYNGGWKGKTAHLMHKDIKMLKDRYQIDSIQFHDNNFFVSEKRVIEFSKLMLSEGLNWWGEARIDTVNQFKDSTLQLMRDAGCTIIYFGAEAGSDEILKLLDKGGSLTAEKTLKFAERLGTFDIIPEYSFVLGTPAETQRKVEYHIDQNIKFIKEIKAINPKTEIIIYVYSPIPLPGADLFNMAQQKGFSFPRQLKDWLKEEWVAFDQRKKPTTPWLPHRLLKKITNFETVINAKYPTCSDTKLSVFQKKMISAIAYLRYAFDIHRAPLELRFLQSKWLKYRQPEIEGF